MKQEEENSKAVYFKSLTIENINCFKSEQTIDLTDGEDNPAMWTVILGNNNTGKTTLLRCLAFNDRYRTPPIFNPSRDQDITDESLEVSINDIKFFKRAIMSSYIVGKIHVNVYNKSEGSLIIDGYGTQRKQGKSTFIEYKLDDRTESLFKDDVDSIINAEEWFLGIKFDALNGDKKAKNNLQQITDTLVYILPDIKNIEVGGNGNRRLHFITKGDQKVLVNQLGSGYQSLVTWVVDLAKRMFDRYPGSDNPLAEPAIVLVDEIDLHLHPEWQRKIVSFLRGKFPKTQFIVTAHSPLVIQSADDINVVVLQKDKKTDEVSIYQPKETNFQGWTVEEILSDLMQMGDNVYSDEYLKWMKQFDEALDTDNYQKATEAYEELSKMVYSSSTLKMLRIQMSSLMPESND